MKEVKNVALTRNESISSIDDETSWIDTKVTQETIVSKLLYPVNPNLPAPKYKIPLNCPKSLEPLCRYENLIIHRRPENAIDLADEHSLFAFVQYDIVNSDGQQVYVAVEETTHNSVTWIRDARLFNVTMYDHDCNKVLTIKRPWTCCFCFAQYYCFLCMFGFRGCGSKAIVTLCDGNKTLGFVTQKLSMEQTCLEIYDNEKKYILSIFGRLVDGIFDIFRSQYDEEPIAMIETSMTAKQLADLYKIKFSEYEDPYGITFFLPEVHPSHKALIISAVILMDYIFCKTNGDYPTWIQFIPADFKPGPATAEKILRDDSKEIIVTSMRPRHLRHRKTRKCSCCRWFCGLICLCCPLGMARNAARCWQLIGFSVILILLLFVGIGYLIANA